MTDEITDEEIEALHIHMCRRFIIDKIVVDHYLLRTVIHEFLRQKKEYQTCDFDWIENRYKNEVLWQSGIVEFIIRDKRMRACGAMD